MAATADERLVVMLEARISEFEKRMSQAERRGTQTYQRLRRGSQTATRAMEQDMVRSTGRINQALASTTSRIGTFGRAMIGGLAAGAVTAALAAITTNLRGTVRGIAEIGDQARRAGLGVEEFQQWAFVADQNRIAVDALVDGFKELNLRADEFIVTGGGSAAESFRRLGFSAEELRRRLQDPSELMLEIVRRLQSLDAAAQIRITDELLGGTAGERFVELLAQGEDGLRRMLARASEVGGVMSGDMVDSAADLDRRFSELATEAGHFFKWVAVGVGDFVLQVANLRNEIEGIQGLRDQRQGTSLLGGPAAQALQEDSAAAREHAGTVRDLLILYERLQGGAMALVPAIRRLSDELHDAGQTEAAAAVAALAGGIETLGQQLDAGEVTASDYERQMQDLVTEAQTALDTVGDLDTPTFTRVIARLGDLGRMLTQLTTQATTLRASLPGRPGMTEGVPLFDQGGSYMPQDMLGGRRASPPPPAPLEGSLVHGTTTATPGSGVSATGYAAAAAQIRERTQALELEAATLVAAAASEHDYGDAIEYARQRAELMQAAQQEGRQITPALQAEIDALAAAYVTAGLSAEEAADRMQRVHDQTQHGIDALVGLFGAVRQGSDAAREAVARLLEQMADAQFRQFLQGLTGKGGGGFLGMIGQLLGFDNGGYTGDGGTLEPKGIVHGGEFVFSKKAVQSIGVARLERMHQAAKGYASGGYVGGASTANQGSAQGMNGRLQIDLGEGLEARILEQSAQQSIEITKAASGQIIRSLPGQIAAYSRNPRLRG